METTKYCNKRTRISLVTVNLKNNSQEVFRLSGEVVVQTNNNQPALDVVVYGSIEQAARYIQPVSYNRLRRVVGYDTQYQHNFNDIPHYQVLWVYLRYETDTGDVYDRDENNNAISVFTKAWTVAQPLPEYPAFNAPFYAYYINQMFFIEAIEIKSFRFQKFYKKTEVNSIICTCDDCPQGLCKINNGAGIHRCVDCKKLLSTINNTERQVRRINRGR